LDWSDWVAYIQAAWIGLFDFVRRTGKFTGVHFEKVIGLAGFSFGVWRWWYYRERVLHKRLQEYLAEQDRRLEGARSYVLEAIFRPGPKRRFFADPLFVVAPLRSLLRRRGWDTLLGMGNAETVADRKLRYALGRIERRVEAGTAALAALRRQMAAAHVLKGAIACARAERSAVQRAELDDRALTEFRTAQQVIEHEHDLQAKEYEAHQLRKLGHLREALAAYEQLEEFALSIPDQRKRDLILAKSKRHRAEIVQAQAIDDCRRGLKSTRGSGVARDLVNQMGEGALDLRAPHGPFHDWDGIEQGELHYLSAFVYHNLGANLQEPAQLARAETAYKTVLDRLPSSRVFGSSSVKRLRAAAQGGLERVR
jgi:tetratricopeptide (TPR) repeat protein